jgi:hypothetical protein
MQSCMEEGIQQMRYDAPMRPTLLSTIAAGNLLD